MKRVVCKRILHSKKMRTERQSETHIIYSITVRKVSDKHPNEISQRIIIMSAMLAQERLCHEFTPTKMCALTSDTTNVITIDYQ